MSMLKKLYFDVPETAPEINISHSIVTEYSSNMADWAFDLASKEPVISMSGLDWHHNAKKKINAGFT